MVARIIPLFRGHWKECDWTAAETAELYRIEHSLIQARLAVQTDRGVTDDGDPWFVFCRTDGEVFVHIARFDGEYHLYSPALPSPLKGRVFSDLSKSFVNQIPLHLPPRRGDDNKLFIHPAATLAIIIGTILIASDESCPYVDDGHRKAAQAGGVSTHEDRAAAVSSKTSLQASFLKFIETYLGGARLGFVDHDSVYLNVVCAIAACVIGAVVAGSDGDSGSLATADAVDDSSAQTHAHAVVSADVGGANEIKFDTLGDRAADAFQANHGNAQSSQSVPSEPDDDASGGLLPLKAAAMSPADAHEASVSVLKLDHDHDHVLALENGNGFEISKVILAPGGGENQTATHSAAIVQGPSPSATIPATTTKGQPDVMSASADQNVHSLLVGLATLFNSDTHSISSSAPLSTSGGAASLQQVLNNVLAGVHPTYDASAQAQLISFWGANPHAQAMYDHQNIIVYDGATPLASAEVHVWDLGHGAVIAVVGHADAPPVHV